MMNGLGIGKSFWRKEYAPRRRVKRRMFLPDAFKVGRVENQCIFDDPDFEDVDPYDWMWDPYGSDMRGSNLHVGRSPLLDGARRDLGSHRERPVEHGVGGGVDRAGLARDGQRHQVRRDLAGADDRERLRVVQSGGARRADPRGVGVARRAAVLTVLDRQVLVQDAENPCMGFIPFQVYRPTPLQKQMVGISEIEPVEHLQRELDTLRSQRRDAATLALCAGYAFDDGALDEDDLVFGPAAAIAVHNARPQDALMPLNVRDVPGSGYQEEQVIRQDFDAVTG
jgi:hypothetical protein